MRDLYLYDYQIYQVIVICGYYKSYNQIYLIIIIYGTA